MLPYVGCASKREVASAWRIVMNFPGTRWKMGAPLALLVICLGCGGGSSSSSSQQTPANNPPPAGPTDAQYLAQAEVQSVVSATAVAVSDRAGRVLAVFRKTGAPATAAGNFSVVVDANELAVALARTAAFFSNDQAPLSSRTVRFRWEERR